MALTTEQIQARQFAVGGSDAAAALGLSPRKTARQLFHEKRGEIEPEEYDTEAIWWGNALEPIVRQKYAEVTGNVVRLPVGTIVHPEHEFMVAHIDGYVDNTTPRRGYEGKTAFHSTGWGEEGSDQIPISYLLQVQHYMIITDLPVFDVCCLIGRKFAFYEVPAPDAEMREMIIEGERDFMRRVREGDPPPLDYQHKTALDVIKKIYPGTNGQRLMADEKMIEIRMEREHWAAQEKLAKAEKEARTAQMLDFMGQAALLAFPDGKAFRRQVTNRAGYTVEPTSFVDCRFVNDGQPQHKRGKAAGKAA